MAAPLSYQPLERLHVLKPVDRCDFIIDQCRGRTVLDLGAYDETALVKQDAGEWLHARIANVARSVLGIDSSSSITSDGINTGPTARIIRGDVAALSAVLPAETTPDVIVAGELLEHLPEPLNFLQQLKTLFPGRQLVASTPNTTNISNVVLALRCRESTHKDHLSVFSFKTLSTLCCRAEFEQFCIVPYHVRYTEMLLRHSGARRRLVRMAESLVSGIESTFPLLSGGYIVNVTRI